MEQSYYIFSIRQSGWYSSGVWDTDIENATAMPRSQALEMCKKHTDFRGLGCLPVSADDIAAVKA